MIGPSYNALHALEAQLQAMQVERDLLGRNISNHALYKGWMNDARMLRTAASFAWSREVTSATLQASRSIPLDTPLVFNASESCMWWHFEEPLPFRVIDQYFGIKAILFGRGSYQGYSISAWLSGAKEEIGYDIIPSQTFGWDLDETLGELLIRCRNQHREIYDHTTGKFKDVKTYLSGQAEDYFMQSAEGIARFILAGLAWINQKIVASDEAHVERHRRKEFTRVIGRVPELRIVHLRRTEQTHHEGPASDDPKRAYSCRFQVDGHWRNQPVGAGRMQRRLTFVTPYVKGPETMPFRASPKKAYVVER
jgi:hypothetical protein